jgi:hypothetical protein
MRPGRRSRARLFYAAAVVGLLAAVVSPAPVSATIEEQRARLPPPAECPDEVEGTWMAIRYEENYSPPEWYNVTIEVLRESPGSKRLKGSMLVHYWLGGAADVQPPPCRPGGYDRVVYQPATGEVSADGKLRMDATSWQPRESFCGGPTPGYNPDHYSGKIDPLLHEFQSVNNDGGRAVNEPAVFRRVRCAPQTPQKPGEVKPPAFVPPRRVSCGRGW